MITFSLLLLVIITMRHFTLISHLQSMKILCLLNDTWHPDPVAFHNVLAKSSPDRRHEVIGRGLFLTPNPTGKRILTVFGDLFKEHTPIFENASTTRPDLGDSGGRPAYNVEHVKNVINRHRPDLVIAFGIAPREAINDMRKAKKTQATELPPVIECIHPAIQKPGWLTKMTQALREVEQVVFCLKEGAKV
jgi:hypothetical protein